jgi:phage tail sheath protein FI
MGFQVSPGVQVKEIDATNVIPAVSTNIGAFVGDFKWGPVETVTTIGSENQLASVFGTPTATSAKYFLTAAAFLKYGNNLQTVRVVDPAAAKNAAVGSAPPLVYNKDHSVKGYDVQGTHTNWGAFIARYPGVSGNAIKIHVCQAETEQTSDSAYDNWAFKGYFDSAPGTSEYATNLGKAATFGDEIHVLVEDATGALTGTKNKILETFANLSIASDAKKADGTSIYFKTVIDTQSQYIFTTTETPSTWTDGTSSHLDVGDEIKGGTEDETAMAVSVEAQSPGSDDYNLIFTLIGGVDGAAVDAADLMRGYDFFADAETIDVNLIFSYPAESSVTDSTLANYLLALAADRKDCVAFVSPPVACTNAGTTDSSKVKTWSDVTTPATSYGVTDSSALYVYDKYHDDYVWIGASGHMAGLCAATDNTNDPWWSPAGYTRGQLFGVTKLAFNPIKAERDILYKARVNPIVSFPGQGTLLFGDKTLQAKPSAFDRINVRRLFIVLEKAISTAAKYQLFEFNDEFTQAMFRNMVEPFLRDVKGRRGITDFLVVCDSTNNTGQIVDTNQFVADIYIKPARSINFITLNFIATRTGVDFSEIAG